MNLSSKKSECTTEVTETDTSSEKLQVDLQTNDLESKLDDEFKTLPEVKKCEENGGNEKETWYTSGSSVNHRDWVVYPVWFYFVSVIVLTESLYLHYLYKILFITIIIITYLL